MIFYIIEIAICLVLICIAMITLGRTSEEEKIVVRGYKVKIIAFLSLLVGVFFLIGICSWIINDYGEYMQTSDDLMWSLIESFLMMLSIAWMLSIRGGK